VTREEIRGAVLAVLGEIAPEADLAGLAPDVDFRDQLEIDSMDLLNFAIGVHARLGVEIPEADYPKLSSLAAAVAYLAAKLGTPG
jgi:acyl carrier protein